MHSLSAQELRWLKQQQRRTRFQHDAVPDDSPVLSTMQCWTPKVPRPISMAETLEEAACRRTNPQQVTSCLPHLGYVRHYVPVNVHNSNLIRAWQCCHKHQGFEKPCGSMVGAIFYASVLLLEGTCLGQGLLGQICETEPAGEQDCMLFRCCVRWTAAVRRPWQSHKPPQNIMCLVDCNIKPDCSVRQTH